MRSHPFFAALLMLSSASTCAAEAPSTAQTLHDLNRDVWTPFARGVASFDHRAYSGVRSRDSVFIDGKRIFDFEDYVEDAVRVMRPMKEAGTQIEMHVRFVERTVTDRYASERGVLQVIVKDKKNEERRSHARFHVISRKEAGVWRILTDYRWRTDAQADAAAFDAARPLEDVDGFR